MSTTTRDPRNWRTEHAVLQATVDARRELALHAARHAAITARIAPPPTGSREIQRWLLAALLVLAAFVIATVAPGAAWAAPINCQGDVDYFADVTGSRPAGLATWLTDCGYRYDWPAAPVLPLPPVIEPHTPPVPEPAAWMLMAAGLGALLLVLLVRALRAAIALDTPPQDDQP